MNTGECELDLLSDKITAVSDAERAAAPCALEAIADSRQDACRGVDHLNRLLGLA
jgi:hypothetical protein